MNDDGLERIEQRLAELSAHIDAAKHEQLSLIAEFDRREGWARGGFRSAAQWLGVRIGLGQVAAREHVRVARARRGGATLECGVEHTRGRALQQLPHTSQALARGQISFSKVRAITRIATPETEEELIGLARCAPASYVEKVVRGYRRAERLQLDRAQRQHQGRYLRTLTDDDGMLVIHGRLPPEVGALLLKALERADSAEAGPDASTPDQRITSDERRADALGRVAEQALSTPGPMQRGESYHVVVHVDAEVLADPAAPGQCGIADGPALSGETVRRLCCDAAVVALAEDAKGTPLSVGRKRRRVSTPLWRALQARDRECCFPGCEQPGRQVHHVRHWADGGETLARNTLMLCDRCHYLVHEGGFTVEGEAPGGFVFRDPDGHALGACGVPPALPDDPVAALQVEHAARGLAIDAWTSEIRWWGEPLDLDWAVHGLMRPRRPAGATVPGAT